MGPMTNRIQQTLSGVEKKNQCSSFHSRSMLVLRLNISTFHCTPSKVCWSTWLCCAALHSTWVARIFAGKIHARADILARGKSSKESGLIYCRVKQFSDKNKKTFYFIAFPSHELSLLERKIALCCCCCAAARCRWNSNSSHSPFAITAAAAAAAVQHTLACAM